LGDRTSNGYPAYKHLAPAIPKGSTFAALWWTRPNIPQFLENLKH